LGYDASRGEILLSDRAHKASALSVRVDVKLLLSSLRATDTQVGEWVRVMGYISASAAKDILVQAQWLHTAGSVDLVEYEKTVSELNALGMDLGSTN
jgi:hypothetical protein